MNRLVIIAICLGLSAIFIAGISYPQYQELKAVLDKIEKKGAELRQEEE